MSRLDEPGTIAGTTANDTFTGTSGNDILRGTNGNDLLHGGEGSDRYKSSVGDGHDSIDDWGDSSSIDLLELGQKNITPMSVSVQRGSADFWDAVLYFGNRDSVTTKGGFFSPSSIVEEIRFADNTVWTMFDVRQTYLDHVSTDGNDAIGGFIDVDDLTHAQSVDDTIYANSGNDTIYGETSDDVVFAGDGDDIIVGSAGDDFLLGQNGADIFVFNDGDGQDWIEDFETASTKSICAALAA